MRRVSGGAGNVVFPVVVLAMWVCSAGVTSPTSVFVICVLFCMYLIFKSFVKVHGE